MTRAVGICWVLVLCTMFLAPHAGGMALCFCADGNRVVEPGCSGTACMCTDAQPEGSRVRDDSDATCGSCTRMPLSTVAAAATVAPAQFRVMTAGVLAPFAVFYHAVEVERNSGWPASLPARPTDASRMTRAVVIQI